jgi:hypothetical protein
MQESQSKDSCAPTMPTVLHMEMKALFATEALVSTLGLDPLLRSQYKALCADQILTAEKVWCASMEAAITNTSTQTFAKSPTIAKLDGDATRASVKDHHSHLPQLFVERLLADPVRNVSEEPALTLLSNSLNDFVITYFTESTSDRGT